MPGAEFNDVIDALQALGHDVLQSPTSHDPVMSRAHAILLRDGHLAGAADPRGRAGVAITWQPILSGCIPGEPLPRVRVTTSLPGPDVSQYPRQANAEVVMDTVQGKRPGDEGPQRPAYLPLPVTSAEAITVLAHFHRAEIARMTGWRDRIDLTTNWAITVVAGMLSVSLSTPTAHHGVLLFAMVLVLLLLSIEARRYRFFDVYRTRVRRLERNYYAQVFAPRAETEEEWARHLGEDLREPRFVVSLRTAIARRLRRNYFWMFLVLLAGWVLKISSSWLLQDMAPADPVKPVPGAIQNLALGPVPGWAVLIAVSGFYCWLAYITFRPSEKAGELAHGDVHV